MKISNLELWEVFLGICKYGHFSRTAEAMNMPLPVLSKKVSKLEELVGARLFHRTTRSVSLTDEARAILPQVQSLIEDADELENSFQEKHKKLSGTIRM